MADENTVSEQPDANPPSDQSADSQSRGVFVPLIFGGAVATALGFFGGQLESVEEALGWADDNTQLEQTLAAQDQKLAAQAKQIAGLTAQLENLPEAPEAAEPVDLTGVDAALAALTARIDSLEKRPMTEGLSQDAIAAYEAELSKLRDAVQSELAAAKETQEQAAQKERAAKSRAAVSDIVVALDSGQPYADALKELTGVFDGEIPAVLSQSAADGVATLASLQADFPQIARRALSSARSDAAETDGSGGFGSFLQRQLGARSVTPKEGSGPDAVLSRAEAAVRSGQLDAALSEIETLPESAKGVVADWVSAASSRTNAMTAARDLMASFSSN